MTQKSTINVTEFEKTERRPVTHREFDNFAKTVMSQRTHPQRKSENREPTKTELNQKFKFVRR